MANPPAPDAAEDIDFGFWTSFWTYVKADALSYVDSFYIIRYYAA